MQDEYKEYVVGLKKSDDPSVYDSIWAQIERESEGIEHIPDEALSITDERFGSYRLCHYNMTDAQAEKLRQHPQVEVVEIPAYNRPNLKIGIRTTQFGNFTKTDSKSGNNLNWGLIRHSISPNAYGDSMSTTESYTYLLDGSGVDVVVHDTGLQVDHPEFTDEGGNSRVQLINWYEAAGISGKSQSSGVYTDTYGHGTHVGGIMAGKTYGWAKNARIYVMPVAGLSPYGFDMNECFDLVKLWHRNKPINPATGVKRPTVVNMSWGYSWGDYGSLSGNYRGQAISSLNSSHGITGNSISIRVASVDINVQEMLDEGIIVVTAAGNANAKIDAPGGIDYNNYFNDGYDQYYYHRGMSPYTDGTINVGCLDYSTDGNGGERKATFSNAGPGVEIFAAGHRIMSACSNSDQMGGSAPYYADGRFRQTNISGTSMAAPQVAGMIALYLQAKPAASVVEVYNWVNSQRTQLMYTSGVDNDYTNNRSQFGGNAGIIKSYNIQELLVSLPRMLDGPITSTANIVGTILPSESSSGGQVTQLYYQTPGRYKLRIPSGVTKLNALCIGGGGGGASGTRAGGGGGGGLRWKKNIDVRPNEIFYITVGAGGAGATVAGHGTTGGDSIVTRSGVPVLVGGGGKRGRNGGPFAAGGRGSNLSTYKFVNKRFDGVTESMSGDVDAVSNSIYLPGHTLKNGDVVMYRSGAWYFPGYNEEHDIWTFKNASDDLYENDLYFVHQVSGDWIKLQHYAATIPGWSASFLKRRENIPLDKLDDPSFDGAQHIWTNNPGTYNPIGPAVDLSANTGDINRETYDFLFKVEDNSINYYGINLIVNNPLYFLGNLYAYDRTWGISWDLKFENVFGGDGGAGGIDWNAYANSWTSWSYSGGGGGAGSYGFERTPQNIYDYANKLWESGTGSLNTTRVLSNSREILYRGEGGSGASNYPLSVSKSSVYSQKALPGTMYGANGGLHGSNRGGGGGGTGIAKFNDTTTIFNNTLNWYSSVGYSLGGNYYSTPPQFGTGGAKSLLGITAGINAAVTSRVYLDRSGTTTSVNGTGALFTVTKTGTTYTVDIGSSAGTGYAFDDYITIPGKDLGGYSMVNNLIIKVTSVGASGQITGILQMSASIYSGAGRAHDGTILLQEDGIKSITITSGGTDYFPAPIVAIRPPRMYRVTSADVTDAGYTPSSLQPYRYSLHIVDHGYVGGELVGMNIFDEDNVSVMQSPSFYNFSGHPVAGYGSLGVNTYAYVDIATLKPTGATDWGTAKQPNSAMNSGYYANGYKRQTYTSYFFVDVVDKDNIRLYGDLLNKARGYFTGITQGTVKIYNAEWWNWPSVRCTQINEDTGAVEVVEINKIGRGMYSMGDDGHLVSKPVAISVYGTGTGATFSVELNDNVGTITDFDITSTIGHFSPSQVEIYAASRSPNYFYPRTRIGFNSGVEGDLNSSLARFNSDANLLAYYGPVIEPTLTTTVSDSRLIVEQSGTAYLHQSFNWKVRISTYGDTLQTSNGTTGSYSSNGHGGKYGGGGAGASGTYSGNGADGCVFISLGTDSTWPSIKGLIADYDAGPISPPGVGEDLTPFEQALKLQRINEDLDEDSAE